MTKTRRGRGRRGARQSGMYAKPLTGGASYLKIPITTAANVQAPNNIVALLQAAGLSTTNITGVRLIAVTTAAASVNQNGGSGTALTGTFQPYVLFNDGQQYINNDITKPMRVKPSSRNPASFWKAETDNSVLFTSGFAGSTGTSTGPNAVEYVEIAIRFGTIPS